MSARSSCRFRQFPRLAPSRGPFRERRLPLRRLQQLHQLAVDELVAADLVAGRERIVLAVDTGDGAAGLAHHDLACGDVPGLQVALPKAVEAAGGDEGEVESGGAKAPQPSDLALDRGHLSTR